MNTGNVASGIKDLRQKSIGSYSKTGTKPYRVFTLDEEIIWDKPLVQILGTNQEPKSMYEMIQKGANVVLFLTGNTPSFTTYIAPILTLSDIKHEEKVDLHIDFITTDNVLACLERESNAEKHGLYI
jgi:altronate dehydratase